MTTHSEIVGNRIKKHRDKLGLTQTQLASRIGIGATSISPIEKGKYLPTMNAARALAGVFKLSIEELLSDTPDKSAAAEIVEKIETKVVAQPTDDVMMQKLDVGPVKPLEIGYKQDFQSFAIPNNIEELKQFYQDFKDLYELSSSDRMLIKLIAVRMLGK